MHRRVICAAVVKKILCLGACVRDTGKRGHGSIALGCSARTAAGACARAVAHLPLFAPPSFAARQLLPPPALPVARAALALERASQGYAPYSAEGSRLQVQWAQQGGGGEVRRALRGCEPKCLEQQQARACSGAAVKWGGGEGPGSSHTRHRHSRPAAADDLSQSRFRSRCQSRHQSRCSAAGPNSASPCRSGLRPRAPAAQGWP